jgi:hypothetical protein
LQAEIAATLKDMDGASKESPEAVRLADSLALRRRVLDDRRRMLSAICDQPVEAERRLGELARIITAHLD